MARIEDKHEKHKVLHNPFHSHEKDDFRVDKAHLNYEFKLKPLKGKLISEVNFELEERKKEKTLQKEQFLKDKEQQKMKKLKKLMAIDPYHPLVVKNSNLVMRMMKSNSGIEPPVASIDNMERFRDASFDMKARFGIVDFEEDPLKQVNRYDVDKRLELIERE